MWSGLIRDPSPILGSVSGNERSRRTMSDLSERQAMCNNVDPSMVCPFGEIPHLRRDSSIGNCLSSPVERTKRNRLFFLPLKRVAKEVFSRNVLGHCSLDKNR